MKECSLILFDCHPASFSLPPLSLSIFHPVSFSYSLSPALSPSLFPPPLSLPLSPLSLSLSLFRPRQQSEEAMALKASTSSKSREVSPEMMEKIIQGKVSKRMSDICLLNQVRRSSLECYKSSYTPLSGVFPFLECIGVPLSSSWTYIHLSITCSATIKNLIYPRTILGTRSGGRIACCLKVFGELW